MQKIKLSEAIRIGAAKRPQTYFSFFRKEANGLCSCALGAAYEGVNLSLPVENERGDIKVSDANYSLFINMFPFLLSLEEQGAKLFRRITYRNDELKWTREQIADWLESEGF